MTSLMLLRFAPSGVGLTPEVGVPIGDPYVVVRPPLIVSVLGAMPELVMPCEAPVAAPLLSEAISCEKPARSMAPEPKVPELAPIWMLTLVGKALLTPQRT